MKIEKYVVKPSQVEVVQLEEIDGKLNVEEIAEWVRANQNAGDQCRVLPDGLRITTMGIDIYVGVGKYVVRDSVNRFYCVTNEELENEYEVAS